MFNFQVRPGSEMSKSNKFKFLADEQCFYLESRCLFDNDKPGVGDDDVELGFMTSETVMTPIPWYCGNRPTVTLANIS